MVVGEVVGHDEMRPPENPGPVWQLVIIGVGIVEEPAFFDHQTPRVDARSITAVPAERPLADGALEAFDGLADSFAFLVLTQKLVSLPSPAMRANVVSVLPDG